MQSNRLVYWVLAFACPVFCADTSVAARQVTYAIECQVAQCGQACMALYPDSNCGARPDLNNSFWAWSTYVIKDTAGLVTPFNLTYESSVSQIRSIGYPIPAENATTGGCPYIQFWFYDTSNQTINFTYITLGQL